jgi:hypothetical protein
VERERLRIKRADSDYLKQQRRRRAAQMRATRVKRKAAGKCRECEARALKDRAYCRRHLLYERGRTKQAPTGTAAPIHSQP